MRPESLAPCAPRSVAGDGPPFEIFNADGGAAVLLLCDHASRFIPPDLNGLGVEPAELGRHIAWDIGAAELCRALATRLDASAVLSGFSRLLIDPNRYPGHEHSILESSDGVEVPGNLDLTAADRADRETRFFRPYHEAISQSLDRLRRRGPAPAVVSIHSFTPMLDGARRPWEIGILWDRDPRLSVPLIQRLSAEGVVTGDNQPYNAREGIGYSLAEHAEPHNLPQALIEVRQDLIDTHHGVADWAERLGGVLGRLLAELGFLEEGCLEEGCK